MEKKKFDIRWAKLPPLGKVTPSYGWLISAHPTLCHSLFQPYWNPWTNTSQSTPGTLGTLRQGDAGTYAKELELRQGLWAYHVRELQESTAKIRARVSPDETTKNEIALCDSNFINSELSKVRVEDKGDTMHEDQKGNHQWLDVYRKVTKT